MSISPEELAAFADGELANDALARVAAAIAADPDLLRQVEVHRALKARLSGHFAPILEQPVPDRLKQLLVGTGDVVNGDGKGGVIDFATASARQRARPRLPGWNWGGVAIAASLVAALTFTTMGSRDSTGSYAGAKLAHALETQLVATQPSDAQPRVMLSFRNGVGEFCRAYGSSKASGIACRDAKGWRFEALGGATANSDSEFRMAGSEAEVLAVAQDMASGPALSAEEEAAARASGWTD